MTLVADLVHETSSTAGASDQTLSAENGKQTFNAAYSTGVGNPFYYYITHRTAAEWEYGIGHLSSASVLVRDTILGSSNAGAAVTFGAGVKDVTSDVPSHRQVKNELGVTNLDKYSADAVSSNVVLRKSRNATFGSHTIVQDGDDLGSILFQGSNGTGFDTAASILAEVDGTPGASADMPGRLSFWTTPNASATPVERMRINNLGFVTISNGALDSQQTEFGFTAQFQINTIGGTTASYHRYSADSGAPWMSFVKSRGATVGTLTATQSGDEMVYLSASGVGSNNLMAQAAIVQIAQDGAAGVNSVPGRIAFSTTAVAGTSPVERLRIDNVGRVFVNHTADVSLGSFPTRFQIAVPVVSDWGISFIGYGNTADGIGFGIGKTRNASPGGHTIVQDGDSLFDFSIHGSDGAAYRKAAAIRAFVDGVPGGSDMPGRLSFHTTPDGTPNTVERLRIDSSGRVTIGSANVAIDSTQSTLQVQDSSTFGFSVLRYGADAVASRLVLAKTRGASASSASVLTAGDDVGAISIYGVNSSNTYSLAAEIVFDSIGIGADYVSTAYILKTGQFDGLKTRYYIDAIGRHSINHTTSDKTIFDLWPQFQINSTASVYVQNSINRYGNDNDGGYTVTCKSRGATIGTHAIVQSNDILGYYMMAGSDGVGFQPAAAVWGAVDGTPGVGDMPGRLVFGTVADGSTSLIERMRIDSQGNVITGGSAADSNFFAGGYIPRFQILGIDSPKSAMGFVRFSADTGPPRFMFAKSRNAALLGQTIVQSDDTLGEFQFQGSDGSFFQTAAAIAAEVDGAPGVTDMPGRLIFKTTPDGTNGLVERMRIDSKGQVSWGFGGAPPLIGGEPVMSSIGVNGDVYYAQQIVQWGNNNFDIKQSFKRTRGSSATNHVALNTSDTVTVLSFQASNGTGFAEVGSIDVLVDTQTPAGGGMPGVFNFVTAATGGGGGIVRYKIDSIGNNVFGSGLGALATTATAGFIYYVGAPGVPTGVPDKDYTGTIPTLIDTANNRLYARIGGSWVNLSGGGGGLGNVVEDTTPELGGNLESNNFDIVMEQYSADAVSADLVFTKSRNAAIGSHTIVADGDDLGRIVFQGSNGTTFDTAAQIMAEVEGTPGATNDMPGRLLFLTTPDNSATLTERMRLTSFGGLGIGSGARTTGILHVAHSATVDAAVAGSNQAGIQIFAYDTGSGGLNINHYVNMVNYNNDGYGEGLTMKYSRGSASAAAIVQANDLIGYLGFMGGQGAGNGFKRAATIEAYVDGTPGASNDMPGRLVFKTTPDGGGSETERLRIDSAGRVNIGFAAASPTMLGGPTRFSVAADATTDYHLQLHAYGNDGSPASLVFTKSRSATPTGFTIVQSGDVLAYIGVRGSDGADMDPQAALIRCVVDGTPGANDMPGRWEFLTTPDGLEDPVERLRIDSAGRIINGGDNQPTNPWGNDHRVLLHSFAANQATLAFGKYSGANSAATDIYFYKSRDAAAGGVTALVDGDGLMYMSWFGGDGTGRSQAAIMQVEVDGTPTAGASVPGRFRFSTAASGSGNPTERMRIDKEGLVGINTGGANFTVSDSTPRFMVADTNPYWSILGLKAHANFGANLALVRTKAGTVSGHATLANGDQIANVYFGGDDGTSYIFNSKIQAEVDGTVSTGNVPQRLVFSTGSGTSFSDIERMRVDSTGRIIIGAPGLTPPNGRFQNHGTSFVTSSVENFRWSNDSGGAWINLYKSHGGVGTQAIVANGDQIGAVDFYGSDGAAFQEAAIVLASVDGTPSAGNMPGRLSFWTTTSGTTPAERARITATGNLIITPNSQSGYAGAYGLIGKIQVHNTGQAGLETFQWSANTNAPFIAFTKSRGAIGTYTALASGDGVGYITAQGVTVNDTALSISEAGSITFEVDGAVSSGVLPGRMLLNTANSSGTLIERLRLKSDGTWSVNANAQGIVWSDATFDVVFGWDDSAGTYKSLLLADILTEGAPAAGDFVLIYGAEGDLRKVNWSSLPGAGGGINNVVEDTTPELGGNLESNNFDVIMEQYSADAVSADLVFTKSRNAAIGSHTIVQDGDDLGRLIFSGSNGTTFDTAAQILAEIDGTPGATTDMPGRLSFWTTPDASATPVERMRIDNAGHITSGGSPFSGTWGGTGRLQLLSKTTDSNLSLQRYDSVGNNGPWMTFDRSRSDTDGVHTVLQDGDTLGSMHFGGSDGTNFEEGAGISAYVDGTPGNNDMPGRLVFRTTPDAATAAVERMRINSAGQVGIGGAPLAGKFLSGAVNGLLQVLATSGEAVLGIARFSNGATPGRIHLAKSRGATVGDYTIVANGDQLGEISFEGSDGVLFDPAAAIRGEVDGTPGATNDMPGRLVFLTSAEGSITPTERLRIKSDGTFSYVNNTVGAVYADEALDVLWGWDDSTSTYKNMTLAVIATEAAPAAGDFVLIYGAEGDLRKVNWSGLPGGGGGINNVVEDTTPQLGGDLDLNGFSITGSGNTVTVSDPILDVSQTWNAGGVTFTGLKANFTITAAANASRVVDIQIGGVSIFYTNTIDGGFTFRPATAAISSAALTVQNNSGNSAMIVQGAGSVDIYNTTASFGINFQAANSGINFGAGRVWLSDEAANVLAQKVGTSAQEFRVYNTADAGLALPTNYERFAIGWRSNVLQLAAEIGGTGTARDIWIVPQAGRVVRFHDQSGSNMTISGQTIQGWFTTSARGTIGLDTDLIYTTSTSARHRFRAAEGGVHIAFESQINDTILTHTLGGHQRNFSGSYTGGGDTIQFLGMDGSTVASGGPYAGGALKVAPGRGWYTAAPGAFTFANAFTGLNTSAATITVTIASPAVVSLSAHGFVPGQPVQFATDGALPTGITAGTTYYVIAAGLAAGSFQIAATHGGAAINTSGTQSGTHTVTCPNDGTIANPVSTIATWGPSGLTGSQTTPVLELAQTWNVSGTSPTAIRLNVIDIASTNQAKLLDLQVGGSSKFYIMRNDDAFFANGLVTTGGISGGTAVFAPAIYTHATGYLGFGDATPGTPDTKLFRDAANIIAQRNSTAAQSFRVYNTASGSPGTDYERGVIDWITAANVLTIGAQAGGAGTLRTVNLVGNVIQFNGVAAVFADAGADAIWGWDDSASQYANLSAADARVALGLATTDSPQFTALNIGAATDTTLARVSAGVISIEGATIATLSTAQTWTALQTMAGITLTSKKLETEVTLTDAANVTLDASLGNTFKLTAAGNRQIDAPTNKPASTFVQKIVIAHEASGADRTLTLQTGVAGGFRFGTDITGLTATTSGLVDYIGCIYNDADDRWDVVSYVKGF